MTYVFSRYRIFRRKGRIAVKAAPPILTTFLGEKKKSGKGKSRENLPQKIHRRENKGQDFYYIDFLKTVIQRVFAVMSLENY